MNKQRYEFLASQIVDAALEVHRQMGPGLLESIYELCMYEELKLRGIDVLKQFSLPLVYKNIQINKSFRIDLLIEQSIIIEVKAVEVILPIHSAQLISYLKLANCRLGFLINFNAELLKKGIKRYVNQY